MARVELDLIRSGAGEAAHRTIFIALGVSDRTQFGDLLVPTAGDVPAERKLSSVSNSGVFTAARDLPALCGGDIRADVSDLADT